MFYLHTVNIDQLTAKTFKFMFHQIVVSQQATHCGYLKPFFFWKSPANLKAHALFFETQYSLGPICPTGTHIRVIDWYQHQQLDNCQNTAQVEPPIHKSWPSLCHVGILLWWICCLLLVHMLTVGVLCAANKRCTPAVWVAVQTYRQTRWPRGKTGRYV